MTLVSDNIRYLRKLNGLTQEQFSRKINIKRSLLGAYEEGRANPNQQNIQAIAKAFNTTVELLTRQDLRKLRETPNLSIPLGQPARYADTRPTAIRTDGKLDADEDDPFQHPDFPDIFAAPSPSAAPEPQPLSSVLNKYSRPQEEARPVPPVITPPVRPVQSRPEQERLQPAGFTSEPATVNPPNRSGRSAMDDLFNPSPEPRPAPPVSQSTFSYPAENQTFNNVYDSQSSPARPAQQTQSVAPAIPVVMQRQFAEYGQRYQQADFLHRLPAMNLPTLPEGQYRAFEAGDDFTFPGALLVGKFIRNWFDIADGKLYVLLTHQSPSSSGIVCRRVYNQLKVKGLLLLTADRTDIPNREVGLKDVLEVWEICAFVSQQLPPPAPNIDRLQQLVEELRFEVGRL